MKTNNVDMGNRSNADSGIRGTDTLDPAQSLLNEHREGKHSGRRWREDCRHCQESLNRAPAFTPAAGPDGDPPPDGEPWPIDDDPEQELRTLWNLLNLAEQDKVVPKAVEYGAADLDIMGFALGVMLNSPGARDHKWTPAELQEMASWFYTLGKVARAFGAMAHGRVPNDDTPHDTGVYARIIQIVRKRGRWM